MAFVPVYRSISLSTEITMKVWVVTINYYDYTEDNKLLGVYSTEEKAKTMLERIGDLGDGAIEIEEVELDTPQGKLCFTFLCEREDPGIFLINVDVIAILDAHYLTDTGTLEFVIPAFSQEEARTRAEAARNRYLEVHGGWPTSSTKPVPLDSLWG
jgi:hypothetical protein